MRRVLFVRVGLAVQGLDVHVPDQRSDVSAPDFNALHTQQIVQPATARDRLLQVQRKRSIEHALAALRVV